MERGKKATSVSLSCAVIDLYRNREVQHGNQANRITPVSTNLHCYSEAENRYQNYQSYQQIFTCSDNAEKSKYQPNDIISDICKKALGAHDAMGI